ncbi:MAG TPA: restriction endonuclease subunit S [Rickettsiales bacterium]|nr:restriction endonuclease subunit S [Rickettsiales bacterium]
MKAFEINFKNLKNDSCLRNDEKFYNFLYESDWNLFKLKGKFISLKDILMDDYKLFNYEEGEEYNGIPTGQSFIDEEGDIKDYQIVNIDEHPGRLKYKVSNENILISSLRLAKSPALLFDNKNLDKYVFSNGFYIFKVKNGWNKKFILYILRSKKLKNILDNHIYRGIGISSYKKDDLLKIKIPLISKEEQDKIVAKIEPIENKIKKLKATIKQPQDVINKVFAREFKFDLKKFEELKKIKNYYLDLSVASKNKDLRNSVVFHQESVRFVIEELNKISKTKIKDFIKEPIVLGSSISPSDFNENGKYYYVSMATVKNYCLELDESQLVSNEYAKSNLNKSIEKLDIIMTRSGVAIGKFALVEEDIDGIFADFTMRIRLNNYNPYFAYYYFRTEYFQHIIHSNKKGLQNKNIFPSQIQEFPMIDISLKEQQKIVDEIKAELDKQELIKKQIELERNKIDTVIQESIK